MLNELKEILSNLYLEHGLSDSIIKLSQIIDILINEEMNNQIYDTMYMREQ